MWPREHSPSRERCFPFIVSFGSPHISHRRRFSTPSDRIRRQFWYKSKQSTWFIILLLS